MYVSKDVIQQDGRSCGPISVELVRAFCEISGDREKIKKLFEILKKSGHESKYKLCKLGSDIIPQSIIDDFNATRQVKFTDNDGKSHYEGVGGEKARKKHYNIATLAKKKCLSSTYFISYIKPFLTKLGADPNLLNLEKLCPSFKSGIITGTKILNQFEIQVEENAVKMSDIKDKKNEDQHCLQRFSPCLASISIASISGIILFSLFLSMNIIRKDVGVVGLGASLTVLICTISIICFTKNKEAKVGTETHYSDIKVKSKSIEDYGSCK